MPLLLLHCTAEVSSLDLGRDGGDMTQADIGVNSDDAGTRDARSHDGGPRDSGALDAARVGPRSCLDVTTDLDVTLPLQPSSEVTLHITMNGMTPPDATGERGSIQATNDVWGSGVSLDAPPRGPIIGTVDVIPGRHTIGLSGRCEQPDETPYCFSMGEDADVRRDSTTTVDMRYGVLDLTITVDGAPFPETNGTARGEVYFHTTMPRFNTSGSIPIAATGAARIQIGAYVGTYEVTFWNNDCSDDLPCGRGSIGTVAVGTEGTRATLDIETARVSGHVTQNGHSFPPTADGPGTLTFSPRGFFSTLTGSVTIDGNSNYAIRVVRGTHYVSFDGRGRGATPGTPVNRRIVAAQQGFRADTIFDIDLSTVDVDLGLTQNGAPLPNHPTILRDAYLRLGSSGQNSSLSIPIADLANGRWTGNIIAGTYSVGFDAPSNCDVTMGVPCLGYTWADRVDLTSNSTQTFNLESHEVTVRLTKDGQPFPDHTADRGSVEFAPLDYYAPRPLYVLVPATGTATATTRLSPGRYAVAYHPPWDGSCESGALGDLPCGRSAIGEIDVNAQGSNTFDLSVGVPAATVSGTVQIGGYALAVPPTATPRLFFTATGDYASFMVPIDANGRFRVTLPLARYHVSYWSELICADRDVRDPRPCASQVIYSCTQPE